MAQTCHQAWYPLWMQPVKAMKAALDYLEESSKGAEIPTYLNMESTRHCHHQFI